MYVVVEYLVYLGIVSFLGLFLFGAAVIGLVAKTGASKLADQAANKLPKIASHLSPRQVADLKNDAQDSLARG
ncbi:MAG TPA: hypothetical protein VFM21_11670 [Terriglobia bacterium]|nr:hypothetical protein [Terriglobia bacterium]